MTDNVERNRAHFDEHAATYNSKWQKTIDQIVDEIRAKKDWIGVDWVEDSDDDSSPEISSGTRKEDAKEVRLLDYACGTGTVSRALGPYVTSSFGIDLSTSMVNEFNKAASNQGLLASEMYAVVGNLVSSSPNPEFGDPKYFGFDIAVVGLGFHHFDDPALAAKRLAERLRKGGVLMIIDFLPSEELGEVHPHGHGHEHSHDHGHSHSHKHSHHHGAESKGGDGDEIPAKTLSAAMKTVTQHGFAIEDVRKMFEDAGAGEGFDFVTLGNAVSFEGTHDESGQGEERKWKFSRKVFMARGVKA